MILNREDAKSRSFFILVFLLVIFASWRFAYAQGPGIEYSPEGCQFTITFPEEPYTSRRCDDGNTDRCYDLVSFTHVYDMNATVNFRVICNPVGRNIYEQYTEEVMIATLRAMTKRTIVESFNASYREEEEYKQAGLVGEGEVGQTSMLYIGQLWIGRESAFSVEAEMIGDQNDKADQLFTDILRTVKFKDDDSTSGEEEPKAE